MSFVAVSPFNVNVILTTNPFLAEEDMLFVAVTVEPDRLNPVIAVITEYDKFPPEEAEADDPLEYCPV